MKLRAPKGEGALTLDELDGFTTGLVALAGRPLLRAERYGVGGLLDRLVGMFGRGNVYVELQRHLLRDQEDDNDTLVVPGRGVSRAARRHRRRALRRRRTSGRCSTCSPAIREHTTLDARRPPAGAQRRALSQAAGADGAAVCRSSRRGARARATLADRLQFTMADLGYRFPKYPVPPTARPRSSFLRKIAEVGARDRYRPYHDQRARADRARARSDREARSRRLLPDRLGHRQLLPAAGHPRAGPRLGGQQRRLLQPRHHRRRSGRHGAAVRAVPVGGARRVARHRSRSAERRSARARDPARLREVRPARRGDDRQRHHLSRPERGARSRQGARRSTTGRSIGSPR